MASIIEKRRNLHRNLHEQQKKNRTLEKGIGHLQALANIGTSTCMIAHEINNLLTPLTNYADLALKQPHDRDLANKALLRTKQSCERASQVMEAILAVASGQSQEKKTVRLKGLVDEIFNCLCRDFKKDGITVKILIPKGLAVWANVVEIQQVIMNLILNARDAMLVNGGILKIEARESRNSVKIIVSDTGIGIDSSNLVKIFEPFITTKYDEYSSPQQSGSGLGLAFCKRVIDEHGGTISVESQIGTGSKFEINLPKQH